MLSTTGVGEYNAIGSLPALRAPAPNPVNLRRACMLEEPSHTGREGERASLSSPAAVDFVTEDRVLR